MKIKGFNKDLKCRGMQFEVGKEYKIESNKEPELCTDTVFHYCDSLQKVHEFYSALPSANNRFCEIETLGTEIVDEEKCGCSHIKIVREIVGDELNILRGLINGNSGMFNSGDSNSGGRNSGNCNSGDSNSGNCNSGDSNSGNCNSGNWNSGNWNNSSRETGFFNTHVVVTINVFNKPCDINTWEGAKKPQFLYFDLINFIPFEKMTDEEKRLNQSAEVCGGYVKRLDYKEAFQKSYNDLSDEERLKQTALLKALPNFDADIFFEISGIRID